MHIDSLKALQEIANSSDEKKKIIFVFGNFNIVHPGHLRLLRFASECGDYLVVGVMGDNLGGDIHVSEQYRLEGITATSWVDYAFILRDKPENFIAELKPAIVVKGKEHEIRDNPELEIVQSYGGKLLFSSGDITFSSINLLREEFTRLDRSTIIKPLDYPVRHNFSLNDLQNVLEQIKDLKVLVIGDTIIDEYITCDPMGMSQEDPTIVVTPVHKEKFLGGAGIVAAHASGLGGNVSFFSVVGQDDIAEYTVAQLKNNNIKPYLYEDESRPTIIKQRFRAHNKTLLRVNHLRQHSINKEIQEKIYNDLVNVLDDIQLLIFSDFNYGCLPQPLVGKLTKLCEQRSIMMVADSQSSSQIGNVSRFNNMSLLTPTEREARIAVRDFDSGLVVVAESLRKYARAKNIFITLGEEGVLIHAEISQKNEWLTDKLPSMNSAPKDIAGAGDSMLTCAAMAMAVGSNIWQSAYLGSIAAACQVGRLGNIPLTTENIEMELR